MFADTPFVICHNLGFVVCAIYSYHLDDRSMNVPLGCWSRVGHRGGGGGGGLWGLKPPFKLMIFISIKMNGKEMTYYAKCSTVSS